jgi:hypothetical protein
VRIIVGFPPGGGTDALARVIGQKLGVMWNQQVIIETKAGVAGVLAAEYVAQQPSDGSTLLMAHINSHALAPALQRQLPTASRHFVPIALVGADAEPSPIRRSRQDRCGLVALCRRSRSRHWFGAGRFGRAALEMFNCRPGRCSPCRTRARR